MISLSAACQRKLHQSTLRSLISWALGDIKLYLLVISASFLVVSDSLQPYGLQSWNSPGKSTGVGFHTFWQGIFPTQRLNPGLPHCRQILYLLNHQGSLKKYPTDVQISSQRVIYLRRVLSPGKHILMTQHKEAILHLPPITKKLLRTF